MALIILKATAIPGVLVVPALAKVVGIEAVVVPQSAYIMVARQDPVRNARFIQHPIGCVSLFPFSHVGLIVDDVAVVEQVLNVHTLPVGNNPVVDVQLVLILSVVALIRVALIVLIVILGIAFNGEGKVVAFSWRIIHIRSGHGLALCPRRILGGGIAFSVLHHNLHSAVYQVVFQSHRSLKGHNSRFRRLGGYLIPALGSGIVHIQIGL